MFNIQEFKSYIGETGVLPVNKFFVEIPTPRALASTSTGISRELQFRAEAVRVPGIAIATTQVHRYGIGPIQKFPFNANFTDMSVSFIADKHSLIWKFFYKWLNNVFSYNETLPSGYGSGPDYNSYRSNYRIDYTVDMKVHIYDSDGEPSMSIEILDCFPVSMNDVELAWDNNNKLLNITVSFTFRDWRIIGTNMEDTSTVAAGNIPLLIPASGNVISTVVQTVFGIK